MIFERITVLFVFVSLSFSMQAQDENTRILSTYYEFKQGSTEMLYGDKVVFRKFPSASSEPIDTLSIGDEIKIIERMDETMSLNGRESHWYKVKNGKKTGYVLGGLIALDHKEINGDTYLVILSGDELNFFARVRIVKKDGSYYGHESRINTNSFFIEVFDNRGIDSIENILCINLFAEACGVDGGEVYLFNDGSRLIEAISLVRVADGGSYWFNESLTFPSDEIGYGWITYKRESGEALNEDMEWSRSVVHSIVLHWENGAFRPKKEDLDFGNE